LKIFILNKDPDRDNSVRLEGNDYRYLVRVKRLAVGEFFPALLPNGKEILVQILSINSNTLIGKCIKAGENLSCEEHSSRLPFMPPLILFQALPKGDKMDLIVRQAAEGGITEIVPFVSEFSFGNAGGQKLTRWERIIKEARQQSGSKTATALHSPLTMNELIEYWHKITENEKLGLIFHHPTPEDLDAKSYAGGLEQNSLHGYLNSNPKKVVLVIGPEGGFSGKEVALFLENDFKPITVGDTVLRTETAALYCAAAIRILLLEKNSWKLKEECLTARKTPNRVKTGSG
jgi:16S rRNA (uracil1498-N3)-methyltransferase